MSRGTFVLPFDRSNNDQRNAYSQLTGLKSFGGFKEANYNPLFNPKVKPSEDSIINRASVRANALGARFNINSFLDSAYDKPKNTLTLAMDSLGKEIGRITGSPVMWDKDGYLAYEIVDKYNNTSWSTNLTRLRRAFMRGLATDDDGPTIAGFGGPTKASSALATNRVWGPVISWHKLVNATNQYSSSYRNMGIDEAFTKFAYRKAKNTTNRLYYLSRNPEELSKYKAKVNNSIQKISNRYNARMTLIDGIVKGLNPQQAAAQEVANVAGSVVANEAGQAMDSENMGGANE